MKSQKPYLATIHMFKIFQGEFLNIQSGEYMHKIIFQDITYACTRSKILTSRRIQNSFESKSSPSHWIDWLISIIDAIKYSYHENLISFRNVIPDLLTELPQFVNVSITFPFTHLERNLVIGINAGRNIIVLIRIGKCSLRPKSMMFHAIVSPKNGYWDSTRPWTISKYD